MKKKISGIFNINNIFEISIAGIFIGLLCLMAQFVFYLYTYDTDGERLLSDYGALLFVVIFMLFVMGSIIYILYRVYGIVFSGLGFLVTKIKTKTRRKK